MAKVTLPMMVQDPALELEEGVKLIRNVEMEDEFFLDGPISRRVAILDFDDTSGALREGVRLLPEVPGRKVGGYAIADRDDLHSRDLLAVSVFATIHKTMAMFETPDVLGRPLTWAFDGPQLLVVPRAGVDANAYYERESHSLQFFYFQSHEDEDRTIFSCASRDIVAHETGHAILDGILPDLYNASTPQALALHEAIADLIALLGSFDNKDLATAILRRTKGSLDESTAFSDIAEEFGVGRGGGRPLRSLKNAKSLDPKAGKDNFVHDDEPHDLSEVLSGALYGTMVAVYAQRRKKDATEGAALGIAALIFRRMVFRALDYLPPGEVSFADFGRAVLAADASHYPDDDSGRKALIKEFVKRKIVPKESALDVKTNFRVKAVEAVDVETLCTSDWAAYEFVNANRKLFGMPEKVHFRVLPRRDSKKIDIHRGKVKVETRECIFKVSWDQKEGQALGGRFPAQRQITVGATLVIDWETRKVRALLQSDHREQKASREAMLKRLAAAGRLRLADELPLTKRSTPHTAARAEVMGDLMRVRGTGRMLHIAR